MRSSWTNIHNIMLKLCLNPNYKQVLGELSQPVITGSTPGHRVRRTVAHKGSSLLGSVQQSSSVRGKRQTTRVLYDVLNSVIDFMMMIMHTSLTCIEVWPTWRNITNAILYIGLRGYCTPGPYFWRLCAFSQNIKQLWTKYLVDLNRNVPRNSKITVLLQLRPLLWSYSEKCAKINIFHVLSHKSITTWVSEIPVQ